VKKRHNQWNQVFQTAFHYAHKTFQEGGLCLEFGVGSGRSYIWQVEQILKKYTASKLIGFDCWQGLPKETKDVWTYHFHEEGQQYYPKSMVEDLIRVLQIDVADPRFTFVDGLFSESLTDELQSKFCDHNNLIFVNIDVDIHKSTIEVLNFIKPILRKGAIIYFDDMREPTDKGYFLGEWGEYLAWKQFLIANSNIKVQLLGITSEKTQRFFEIVSI